MRHPTENSKQTLERFLNHLGDPVPDSQAENASSNVLDRLRSEDVRVPLRVLTLPTVTRPVRTPAWSTIAAVGALMLTGALLHMALLNLRAPHAVASSVRGDVTFVADGRDAAYSHVESGRGLRAGENGGVLTLPDGSHVDMSPRAELSVVRAAGDLRVRLASGTVLIKAAKQKDGHHLFVETQDCLISVIGTVFQVNAERSGSRISVIEGEVHVQRGELSQTLVAGQQASTSPELGPLVQEVPATVLIAQQNVPTPPTPPAPLPEAPKPFDDIVWVAAPTVQNGNGTVRGVVKNGTGDGIPEVTITLCPTGTRVTSHFAPAEQTPNGVVARDKTYFFALWDSARCQQNSVKTDSMGRFEFRSVGAGTYLVSADREGYSSGRYNLSPDGLRIFRGFNYSVGHTYTIEEGTQRGFSTAYTRAAVSKGDQTTATLGTNDSVVEVSLTLVRGSFSGHVRDADGRPVPNAVVRIVARSAGAATDGQTVAVTLTNDQGEYKIYGLPAGEYRVAATVPSGLPGSEIWFSRNPNPGGITGLTVSEGEEITNIDMVVPRR